MITNVQSKQGIGQIDVTWEDAETDALVYEVWASVSGGAYSYLATVGGTIKTYGDDVNNFATTTYKIRKGYGPLARLSSPSNIISADAVEGVLLNYLQGSVVDNVSILIAVTTGKVVKLNWGYGTDITLVANGTPGTYTSNFPTGNVNYEIGLKGDVDEILYFKMVGTEPGMTVELSQIKKMTRLTYLSLLCVFHGVPSDLPTSLTYLYLYGYGDAAVIGEDGLPPAIEEFRYYTADIASWVVNITNLPSTLKITDSVGSLAVIGDIADIPSAMTNFSHWGNPNYTNLFGDLSDLKEGLKQFRIEDVGEDITGDIATVPTTLEEIFIIGESARYLQLTGSIADLITRCPNLTVLALRRCGNFTGSIDGALDEYGFFVIQVDSTKPGYIRSVTGDIANAPLCTGGGLILVGLNLTGDLKSIKMPESVFGIYLVDNGGGVTATSGVYPIWSNQTLVIQEGLTTAEVDALIVGLAATAVAGVATLALNGGAGAYINQPRSSASDAAVATLQGLGKTVTTN